MGSLSHLWRDILRSPNKSFASLRESQVQAGAEVYNLDVANFVQKDVGRFKIAVNNSAVDARERRTQGEMVSRRVEMSHACVST